MTVRCPGVVDTMAEPALVWSTSRLTGLPGSPCGTVTVTDPCGIGWLRCTVRDCPTALPGKAESQALRGLPSKAAAGSAPGRTLPS